MDIQSIIIAASIPSGITAFFFWVVERKISRNDERNQEERRKRQAEIDKREEARRKSELYLLQSVSASIALGEATAKAVQRIPDAHCNGDMHQALEYAEKVKHEQKEFLQEQAIDNILN